MSKADYDGLTFHPPPAPGRSIARASNREFISNKEGVEYVGITGNMRSSSTKAQFEMITKSSK